MFDMVTNILVYYKLLKDLVTDARRTHNELGKKIILINQTNSIMSGKGSLKS